MTRRDVDSLDQLIRRLSYIPTRKHFVSRPPSGSHHMEFAHHLLLFFSTSQNRASFQRGCPMGRGQGALSLALVRLVPTFRRESGLPPFSFEYLFSLLYLHHKNPFLPLFLCSSSFSPFPGGDQGIADLHHNPLVVFISKGLLSTMVPSPFLTLIISKKFFSLIKVVFSFFFLLFLFLFF
jgi:hypothetical protein